MEHEQWINVVLPQSVADKLERQAKQEHRSRGRHGGLVLELGLQEFERREAVRNAAVEGKTQIDPSLVERSR